MKPNMMTVNTLKSAALFCSRFSSNWLLVCFDSARETLECGMDVFMEVSPVSLQFSSTFSFCRITFNYMDAPVKDLSGFQICCFIWIPELIVGERIIEFTFVRFNQSIDFPAERQVPVARIVTARHGIIWIPDNRIIWTKAVAGGTASMAVSRSDKMIHHAYAISFEVFNLHRELRMRRLVPVAPNHEWLGHPAKQV